MKNRLVFRIASFLAGVFLSLSFSFGQLPAILKGSPEEAYVRWEHFNRITTEIENWENAVKIGFYETILPAEIVIYYDIRPQEVQPGNEYWMPKYRAKILRILGSSKCLILFDTNDTFYLTGYPTQNLFENEYIVLASPVVCSGVLEGTRVLKFVPKVTLEERRGDALFDENQRKALEIMDYREWELADGTKLWAKYDSVVEGGIVLKEYDGQTKTLKTKELSKKDAKFQIDEWKKHVREERKERAQKRKERDD